MEIRDIFAKDINRQIRGVIKIGQDEDEFKQQELEEYVVTDELKDDFDKFFRAYTASINNPTDEMGVWISGFFGSGKSHFLKILSYLLNNEAVAGKQPVDYFRDDDKLDSKTLNLITKAEQIPADVVLFNIDAKADTNSVSDSSAILTVFLRVFNEQLGYASNLAVANMERFLDDQGYYEAFKDAFRKQRGADWRTTRKNFGFVRDTVKKALADCGAMTEEDAVDYINNINDYQVTPEEFAKIVKNYLDKQGNDRHIVFMADEVGQFIGDKAERMLNLQTIVEELGARCEGRAWVVVTSQQQLNEVTSDFNSKNRQDFSKIQGRFNTMINMTSANADEVIQKRLLAKTDVAETQLADIFEEEQYSINNKIDFSDQIDRQKYTDTASFTTNYPFIPYQFSLLKDVLVAVRKHGAEGKHMSDGERSMLATFQAATQLYEHEEVGTLVPFSAFFNGMYEFLSHDHQVVFTKASQNELVCPNKDTNSFVMQVLQVLFMVKYLDTFPATLENITTLMINSVYADRQSLAKKVKDALDTLVDQKYVQQSLDIYEFLTDKEQDINESISSFDVRDDQLIDRIGNFLSDILTLQYVPKGLEKNKYVFKFNVYIDDLAYGSSKYAQNIRIYTPLYQYDGDPLHQYDGDDKQYRLKAQIGSDVVMVLPEDDRYLSAFRQALQIEQFMQRSSGNTDYKERSIIDGKGAERNELMAKGSQALEADVKDATVYVLSDVLDNSNDINSRLMQAYQEVIDSQYRNLVYLTSIKSSKDIVALFSGDPDQMDPTFNNGKAVQAVIDFLNQRTNRAMPNLSMSSVAERFSKVPYGYSQEDIAWLVAKAFVDGKVRLVYNGEPINLSEAHDNPKKISGYLTNQSSIKNITLKVVQDLSPKQRKIARRYLDILNKRTAFTDDSTEQLANNIKDSTRNFLNDNIGELIRQQKELQGPGDDLLEQAQKELQSIANASDSDRIFGLIENKIDDLEDWNDDMDDRGIREFYASKEQKKIWKRTKDYLVKYADAEGLVGSDNGLKTTVEEMRAKLANANVSKIIQPLKKLNEQFMDEYSDLIDDLYDNYQKFSQERKQTLQQRLADANFPDKYADSINTAIEATFATHDQKAKEDSDVGRYMQLTGEKQALDRSVDQIQQQIDDTSARLTRETQVTHNEVKAITPGTPDEVKPVDFQPVAPVKVKKTKTLLISELESQSWRITDQVELDAYLADLKNKLQGKLKDYDIVNVDFE